MPDFGALFDKLQSLFGRGYAIAGVLPVSIFAALSALIGFSSLTWVRYDILAIAALTGWRLAALVVVGVAALGVLGFVCWSVNATFRGILEGAHLDWPVARQFAGWLRGQHVANKRALDQVVDEATREAGLYRPLCPLYNEPQYAQPTTWRARLRIARTDGLATGVDQAIPRSVLNERSRLWSMRLRNEPIPADDMSELADHVEDALRHASADRLPELATLHLDTKTLGEYGRAQADAALYRAVSRRAAAYPRDEAAIAPTRAGNVAALEREYALSRYGIDAELFWPHFYALTDADSKLRDAFEDAKVRLDFNVSMVAASVTFAIFWTIQLARANAPPAPFLYAALGAPLMAIIFYEAMVRANRTVGDVTRAIIDLRRFEVLKALSIDPPVSSTAERILWQQLVGHAQLTDDTVISYARPPEAHQ